MNEFVPLIGSQTDRGIDPASDGQPTTDQLFQNCLFYPVENPWTGKKTIYVEKRPGIPAVGSAIGVSGYLALTGLHFWRALGTICKYGYTGALVHTITITDTGGDNVLAAVDNTPITGIIEVKNNSGVQSLLVTTTSASTSLLTSCGLFADGDAAFTSVTLPANSVGNLVHMDGYTFIANIDGRIYNSPLNNPAGSYTDFIGADTSLDSLRTLAKVQSHLIAYGEISMEVYRIGEQTTGSPLQRIPEYFQNIGIYFPLGTLSKPPITDGNNTLYWIGTNSNNIGVYTMENMQPKKISGEIQDKYLQAAGDTLKIKYLEVGSRKLVLVAVDAFWLVYDVGLGFWNTWTSDYANNTFNNWYNNYKTQEMIILDSVNPVFWDLGPGDDIPYQDVSTNITRKIRTSIIDGDTNDYKDFPSLSIIGDKQTTTSNITVKWTKDDYQTWNTGRTIDMSSANPKTHALGIARRIAFELTETNNNAGRLRGIELDYNVRR